MSSLYHIKVKTISLEITLYLPAFKVPVIWYWYSPSRPIQPTSKLSPKRYIVLSPARSRRLLSTLVGRDELLGLAHGPLVTVTLLLFDETSLVDSSSTCVKNILSSLTKHFKEVSDNAIRIREKENYFLWLTSLHEMCLILKTSKCQRKSHGWLSGLV